jgi:hypothetical protein
MSRAASDGGSAVCLGIAMLCAGRSQFCRSENLEQHEPAMLMQAKGRRSVRMLWRVMAYKSARDCATLMRRHPRLMRACLLGSRSNINATWPASKKTTKQLINRNFVVSKNRDYY